MDQLNWSNSGTATTSRSVINSPHPNLDAGNLINHGGYYYPNHHHHNHHHDPQQSHRREAAMIVTSPSLTSASASYGYPFNPSIDIENTHSYPRLVTASQLADSTIIGPVISSNNNSSSSTNAQTSQSMPLTQSDHHSDSNPAAAPTAAVSRFPPTSKAVVPQFINTSNSTDNSPVAGADPTNTISSYYTTATTLSSNCTTTNTMGRLSFSEFTGRRGGSSPGLLPLAAPPPLLPPLPSSARARFPHPSAYLLDHIDINIDHGATSHTHTHTDMHTLDSPGYRTTPFSLKLLDNSSYPFSAPDNSSSDNNIGHVDVNVISMTGTNRDGDADGDADVDANRDGRPTSSRQLISRNESDNNDNNGNNNTNPNNNQAQALAGGRWDPRNMSLPFLDQVTRPSAHAVGGISAAPLAASGSSNSAGAGDAGGGPQIQSTRSIQTYQWLDPVIPISDRPSSSPLSLSLASSRSGGKQSSYTIPSSSKNPPAHKSSRSAASSASHHNHHLHHHPSQDIATARSQPTIMAIQTKLTNTSTTSPTSASRPNPNPNSGSGSGSVVPMTPTARTTVPANNGSVQVQPQSQTDQSTSKSHKKHGCSMCHKSFDRPSTLRKHLLVHTGEKAFVCDICGRRFGVNSNLNRHVKRCILRNPTDTSSSIAPAPSTRRGQGQLTTSVPVTRSLSNNNNNNIGSAIPRPSHKRSPPSATAAGKRKAISSPTSSSSSARTPTQSHTHLHHLTPTSAKRRRRPASPNEWVPTSLAPYNLFSIEITKCVSVPLAPVSPLWDPQTNEWIEERDSWDENVGFAPYGKDWKGQLPGPAVGFEGKDVKNLEVHLSGAGGGYVMGRLVLS